ncbi:cytochrome c-type biogenesis protein CcmH [Rhizobiales bacterium GAS191]|nr:cytochrome c-type biogenesis protein CcmH [Rhizobiales bacterium GAS191]
MVLDLIFSAMLVVAMLAILLPLGWRTNLVASVGASPLDLHQLRLAEIERDLERGLLDQPSADSVRNEAARMLLRAADRDPPRPETEQREGEGARKAQARRRAVALVVLVGLPALVLPVYAVLGSPGLPSRPFQAVAPVEGEKVEIATLIGRIEAHLATHPDDGKEYETIAPVYLRLGRFEDGVRARSEALRLLGETADRLAGLAQARIMAAGGVVSREASEEIAKALALNPKHVKARFLRAIALEQEGKPEDAVAAYKTMLSDAPPEARWRAAVEARLARLPAPASGEAAAIAGLPQGAQSAVIRRMVEGLAARLKQQGGSAQEWARLVRSYAVLGDSEKARAALAEARAALPDDVSRATLLQAARASGVEATP